MRFQYVYLHYVCDEFIRFFLLKGNDSFAKSFHVKSRFNLMVQIRISGNLNLNSLLLKKFNSVSKSTSDLVLFGPMGLGPQFA